MRNKRKPYQLCSSPSSSSSNKKEDCQFDISPVFDFERVIPCQSSAENVSDLKMDQSSSPDTDLTKSLIKEHPLFPILQYFFSKCERSTINLNHTNTKVNLDELLSVLKPNSLGNGHSSDDCIKKFDWKTGNDDLDELMLTAVKVLRTQLLELEKVDELCRDFCSRYNACLKGKITQEMLMGWSDAADDDSCSPPPSSLASNLFDGNNSDAPADSLDHVNTRPSAIVATMQTPSGQVSIPLLMPLLITTPAFTSSYTSSSISTSAAAAATTAVLKKPKLDNGAINWLVNGAMAGSVIDKPLPSIDRSIDQTPLKLEKKACEVGTKRRSDSDSGSTSGSVNGKGKRTALPRKAVDILKAWLFQNMRHPYPSEDEKRELCNHSGLSLLQVNNWFINARRRILQPLLDGTSIRNVPCAISTSHEADQNADSAESEPDTLSATPAALELTVRKSRTSGEDACIRNRSSASRYWPESLATGVDLNPDLQKPTEPTMPDALKKSTEEESKPKNDITCK